MLVSLFAVMYILAAAWLLDEVKFCCIIFVPPVVLVMLRKYLSQRLNKGSLSSRMEFMPVYGTSEVRERAPTWYARFITNVAHGIPWEGFFQRPACSYHPAHF